MTRAGRPRLYEDHIQVTVKASIEDIKQAKRMGINVSGVFRVALAEAVNNPQAVEFQEEKDKTVEKFKDIPKEVIDNMVNVMKNTPSFLPRSLEWANSKYGRDITKEDLEKMIPKY